SRYLESRFRSDIAKSQEWWHSIIPKYDDIRFKKIMRMDSQSFQSLINNIEIHTVFQSTGNKQQAPVELQLAIFLRRETNYKIENRIAVEKHIALEEEDVEKERHIAIAFKASVTAAEKVQKVAIKVEKEYFVIVVQ
ncbi:2134_t:CDS:2, partial [Funneliformis geosporum]